MSFRFFSHLAAIALFMALPGTSRAEITLADAASWQIATATDPSCEVDGHYSVLRTPRQDCAVHGESAAVSKDVDARDGEPLNMNILQAEIYAFAVIGVAQIRGGTQLLSDVWYAGAVLVPPFMEQHPDYGIALNYAAITPPFIALGILNGAMQRDGALGPRIFLTNFIGFNLGLLWSHAMLEKARHKASEAQSPSTQRVHSYLFPLPNGDGAGVMMSLQW